MRTWYQSEHNSLHENLYFGVTGPLDKPQRVIGNGKPNPEVGDMMRMSHRGHRRDFVITEFVEEFKNTGLYLDNGYWAVNVELAEEPREYEFPKIESSSQALESKLFCGFLSSAIGAITRALFKKNKR